MKTAVTGEIWTVLEPEGADRAHGHVRIPVVVKGKRAAAEVKVILEIEDWNIPWLIDQLQAIADRRARAHEEQARQLRGKPEVKT